MHQMIATVALTLFFPFAGFGQDVRMPDRIEKLAERASKTVHVTLDGPLLQLAGQFLNSSAEDQQAKKIVSKLKAVHLRTFEFAREGEYSDADVAAYRSQLRAPAWSRIVDANSKQDREHMEVYVKQEKGEVAGVAIICAEPKELTIVNIDGTIDLAQLAKLGGQFGIPKIEVDAEKAASKTSSGGRDSAQ